MVPKSGFQETARNAENRNPVQAAASVRALPQSPGTVREDRRPPAIREDGRVHQRITKVGADEPAAVSGAAVRIHRADLRPGQRRRLDVSEALFGQDTW